MKQRMLGDSLNNASLNKLALKIQQARISALVAKW
jgi:hypothetical protein